MKKKSVRKKASVAYNPYTRYLIIGFVVTTLLFIAAACYQSLKNAALLGIN